jgi:hypothetical protein
MVPRATVCVLLALCACEPSVDAVEVRGVATDGPYSDTPLAGGRIATLDEAANPFAEAEISSVGTFSVTAPTSQTVFVEVSGDGLAPASFSGSSGASPGLAVDDGTFFGVSLSALDAWRAEFVGCEGVGEGGAIVGDVALLGVTDDDGAIVPVAAAWVEVRDAGFGWPYFPCYLDDEGAAVVPDAEVTGATGRFGVFGLPEGVYVMTVGYELFGEPVYEVTWEVWVPEGGVAPRFPVWVELIF